MRFAYSTLLLLATVVAPLATARAQTALTPEQALARAARSNQSLRAAMSDLRVARLSVQSAQDARTPVLVAGVDGSYNERFSGTSAGVARTSDQQLGANVGVSYTTAIGTSLAAGIDTGVTWRQVNRDPTTTDTFGIPPTYTSQATVSARQPLLRGAGTDSILAELRQARAGLDQASYTRDDQASQLIRDVLSAYWELWYAEQSLAVQAQSLETAERQLADARMRSELGTAPRTDMLRFSAQLASIRESQAAAEISRQTRALALGSLLGLPSESAAGLAAGVPPPEPGPEPPLSELVRMARVASPEMLALAASVQAARERVTSASDASLPRLDLTTSLGLAGVWNGADMLPGLQLPGGRPAFVGLVGLELELPLGSSAADADLARSRAQLDAAQQRFEARALAVETSVATLRRSLDAAAARVALATESASIANQLAEAERQRLALGTSTTADLVLAQQSERESALARLRALVDQQATALELDDASGRLLPRYARTFAQEARPR